MAGPGGTSDTLAKPRRHRKLRGQAQGTRAAAVTLLPCLAGTAAVTDRTGTHLCLQRAGLPRRPGPARPGAAGRGWRRCPPFAMPVMSALPAPKVKGAGAKHSPSVLPAGIRQRREAEPCSRPNKSLLARASLAAHAGEQRVLRAGCFRAIIFPRRAHRYRGPPGPESFSMPRPHCFVTRSGRKGHSQWPTFLSSLLALSFQLPTCEAPERNCTSPARGGGAGGAGDAKRGDGRGRDGERGGRVRAEGPCALLVPFPKHLWCQGHCLVRATFKMTFKNLFFAVQFHGCFLRISL